MATLFYISKQGEKLEALKELIDDNIILVKPNNLLTQMYKKNLQGLLVDTLDLEDATLEMIKSVISIVYLPVIYIVNDKEDIYPSIKDEIIIEEGLLPIILKPMIKQLVLSKKRYDNVTESYDAMDLLNGEIKNSLRKYIKMETSQFKTMLKELMDLVFAENVFLNNKPSFI